MAITNEVTFQNKNGTKAVIQVLLSFIVLFNIVVGGYIVFKLKQMESTAVQVAVNTQRIERLEILVQNLPATLAIQSTTLNLMTFTLDKIEKKLDEHMSKGR